MISYTIFLISRNEKKNICRKKAHKKVSNFWVLIYLQQFCINVCILYMYQYIVSIWSIVKVCIWTKQSGYSSRRELSETSWAPPPPPPPPWSGPEPPFFLVGEGGGKIFYIHHNEMSAVCNIFFITICFDGCILLENRPI